MTAPNDTLAALPCYDWEHYIFWLDRSAACSWNAEYRHTMTEHLRKGNPYYRAVRDADGYWIQEVGHPQHQWRHGAEGLEWIMFVMSFLDT